MALGVDVSKKSTGEGLFVGMAGEAFVGEILVDGGDVVRPDGGITGTAGVGITASGARVGRGRGGGAAGRRTAGNLDDLAHADDVGVGDPVVCGECLITTRNVEHRRNFGEGVAALDGIRLHGSRGGRAGRGFGVRTTAAFDVPFDLAALEFALEVGAGTGRAGEHVVRGQRPRGAAVKVRRDAITRADVAAERDGRVVRRFGHRPVGFVAVVGHLKREGLMIVGGTAGCPGTARFGDACTNGPVASDIIVGTCAVAIFVHVRAILGTHVSGHVMDGDLADLVLASIAVFGSKIDALRGQ